MVSGVTSRSFVNISIADKSRVGVPAESGKKQRELILSFALRATARS